MNTYKVCTCGTQTVTSFQSLRATPGGRTKIIIFRLDELLHAVSSDPADKVAVQDVVVDDAVLRHHGHGVIIESSRTGSSFRSSRD